MFKYALVSISCYLILFSLPDKFGDLTVSPSQNFCDALNLDK